MPKTAGRNSNVEKRDFWLWKLPLGLTLWLPLMLFFGFVGLAAYQLTQPKDEFVPSTMIGKPLPEFELPPAALDRPGVSLAVFKDGKPKLLNIWASWCLPWRSTATPIRGSVRMMSRRYSWRLARRVCLRPS